MSEETGTAPPLDLSLLAKVAQTEPEPDRPPHLPPGEPPNYRKTSPRTRAARGRGRAVNAPTATTEEDAGPKKVVRDDAVKEYRPGILVKPLTDLYKSVGLMVLPLNQPVGTAFIQNAQECAQSLDDAARQDPRVRRFLMGILATGVWGNVLVKHMPILLALAATWGPMKQRLAVGEVPEQQETDDVVNPMSNGIARDTRPHRGMGT